MIDLPALSIVELLDLSERIVREFAERGIDVHTVIGPDGTALALAREKNYDET